MCCPVSRRGSGWMTGTSPSDHGCRPGCGSWSRLAAVYAEKIVTALQRGTANTRWRDFADVYLLRGQQDLDGTDLTTALQKVAAYRGVTLRPG